MAIQGVQHGLRGRGGFNVDVKLEGDWIRFNTLVNSLGPTIATAAIGAQKKFAEKYRDAVKGNIRTGGKRFGYPGHSPKYKKYKSKHGGGGRLLYWSGAFENAVEVVDFRDGRVGVGIDKEATRAPYHENEKEVLTISEYANILEHGAYSRGVPARPVFKDTFSQNMKGIRGLQTFIQWHLVRDFGAQGIRLNKI